MGIRVLILEPDEQLLESFQTYFAQMTDFEVQVTTRGDDCVEKLRRFRPDVFVMEPALKSGTAQMILDGIDDAPDVPYVPVLVLTRFSRIEAANHPSVVEYLVKPQSLADITESIRRLALEYPSRPTA